MERRDRADRPNTGGNHGGMHWYYDGQHKLIYVRRDPAGEGNGVSAAQLQLLREMGYLE